MLLMAHELVVPKELCSLFVNVSVNTELSINHLDFHTKSMSGTGISVGSLEEQALKRKERLKNLKQKAKKSVEVSLPEDEPETAENEKGNENETEKPKPSDVVSEMEEQLQALKAPFVVEEIDIQNLAPRKPDWDLKRDVAKKLDILERRTQRAIAELIRDRLQSNKDAVDLNVVNAVGFSSESKESKIVQQDNEE